MNHEEVIAATREWIEKAVIGLNHCPFAKSVYVKNQVRMLNLFECRPKSLYELVRKSPYESNRVGQGVLTSIRG